MLESYLLLKAPGSHKITASLVLGAGVAQPFSTVCFSSSSLAQRLLSWGMGRKTGISLQRAMCRWGGEVEAEACFVKPQVKPVQLNIYYLPETRIKSQSIFVAG